MSYIFDKERLDRFLNTVMNSKQIAIVTHANPDGDAVGSLLGLQHLFHAMGKNCFGIAPNDFPEFLKWLDGAEEILRFDQNTKKCTEVLMVADCIIAVDFNSLDRVGNDLKTLISNSTATKVLVDHHLQPESFAQIKFSTVQTSSTSELIYGIVKKCELLKHVSKKTAEALYVGIITDTGTFSYACNYTNTFLTVAELITKGINPELIHQKVYDTNTENRLKLLGYSLSEKLKVLHEYNTAYISLTKKELESFNFKQGDTEGIVNYALSIKDVNFAAMFIEKKNLIRISFRSKGTFSVNDFARKYYEGGGHKNAAGGNSYVSMENTIAKFEDLLPYHIDEIKNALN